MIFRVFDSLTNIWSLAPCFFSAETDVTAVFVLIWYHVPVLQKTAARGPKGAKLQISVREPNTLNIIIYNGFWLATITFNRL